MTGGARTPPPRKAAPRKAAPRKAAPRKAASVEAPERRRRRRWWVLGTAAGIVVLGWVVLGSPLLSVTRVDVQGAMGGREPEVRRAAGVHDGDALALVWPGRVAGRVEDLPWVDRASVTRSWPHTVRITVEPRVPVGFVHVAGPDGTPGRNLLVDASGQVLWSATQVPGAVPELVGAADVGRPGSRMAPTALARAAGEVARDLAGQATAVVLADGALAVRTTGGTEVRFGRPTDVAAKARVAAAVLATLGDVHPTYLDVSVPSSPVSG